MVKQLLLKKYEILPYRYLILFYFSFFQKIKKELINIYFLNYMKRRFMIRDFAHTVIVII